MSPIEVLQTYFGYDSFRGGQEKLIGAVLGGSDVLGVMPTGAGKSLCYQVPALIMEGTSIVVSPLISLMQDQVRALTQAGVPAACVNSSLDARELSQTLREASEGAFKLLYVAPERLSAPSFISFARSARISLLTVDEAHCISQWGQDFRPSYARIPEFVSLLANRPVLSAFTATATERVRQDVAAQLGLRNPVVLITGFDRPNLYFAVRKPKDKFAELHSFLRTKKGQSGIVYCATRAAVEEVCRRLNECGFGASRYHAGLSDEERQRSQEDFLYDRSSVMVATNAFGMGIDKSNVSFVVHYNMPKDLESYYQEAGRAGRDGQNAECLLLYSGQDVRTQNWMIDNSQDTEDDGEEIAAAVREAARKRLREMTFYAATDKCLRSYILSYFGETAENFCGNCGNCNANYETEDITVDAQKILSCVFRIRENYGAGMVIDILRGSKSERVLAAGFNNLSVYGICDKSAQTLRDIIQYLVMNGFLLKTASEYPVLKLGKGAADVLAGRMSVSMKLLKERPRQPSAGGASPGRGNQARAGAVYGKLYEDLRSLRASIAAEQRVPAYIVFSDATLADMCALLPSTEEEFLRVSGVGQVKLERYGSRFLRVIAGYLS